MNGERGGLPKCPNCSRPLPALAEGEENPSRPFCSPSCKLIDLGRWLDGAYRIPCPPDESDEVAGGENERY